MQVIHIDDPAWLSTFPHPVEPQQDECLPSLLLRCDEANGWMSGTTLAHLRRESHFKQATLLQDLIVPSQLEMLAPLHVWLELPCNSIEATTYHRELASCYEKKRPCFSYLHSSFTFQLCPMCIAESRFLQRVTTLPRLTSCPFHAVKLVQACLCGTPMRLFSLQAPPFTCHHCGLNWAQLPRQRADSAHLMMDQKRLLWYTWFFSRGSPTLLVRAMQLIDDRLLEQGRQPVLFIEEKLAYMREMYRGKIPLGTLVALLVRLDLLPDELGPPS